MRVAVATSLYEAARPYLADWIAGVLRAMPADAEAELVVAAHGFRAPAASLAAISARAQFHIEYLPPSAPIAEVRNVMLAGATRSRADIVVFCDADDALLPGAVTGHAAALAHSDFSYGDMVLIDALGTALQRTLYGDCVVPPRVGGYAALASRNFIGFSNSAVRTSCLNAHWQPAPTSVVAVDWFLFSTLASAGARGARTEAPVAAYRQHDQNLLGAGRSDDLAAARRRCEMAAAHYEALRYLPGNKDRIAVLARLLADPQLLAAAVAAGLTGPSLWFEDVAAWMEYAQLRGAA